MIDGTKCVSDWMIHRRGPSCDQTQFIVWWKFDSKFGQRTTAGSCDDRVWSTGETMRGTGAIVFSTRVYFVLPETVELNSCEVSWGRSTYVSVLTSSLMWYSVCCGESDIVLVVGAQRLRIFSANRHWIQLLDEHSKTSSPTRAAVAWGIYLPLAEHSRSGTPLHSIYRACEEVRGRVATGYNCEALICKKTLSVKITGPLSVKALICKNTGWPLSVTGPYL